MTTTALLFFALAVLLVWGGLVASILRLRADTRREAAEVAHHDPATPGAPR
ncbi:methionine/alanine import family NSS transporter small subunit [Cellulomonas sp. APG4]|uniref:methionine/alanine import family NSS transporter small subunit n=1 Tax=Cellulomonas sp. APG4 TaxID=1538656 RepID=UPI00137A31BE|nr:methionine/alanine import family NSS transporter small subunit [Cellulomonas sp. APG4]NCT91035.1 methionine/alanine import family NSS transporter small subunit [Cellulomonas sp. APG4]